MSGEVQPGVGGPSDSEGHWPGGSPIHKRRISGTTWCQAELCPDPACTDSHMGGTSIFLVGPLPAHRLAYCVYDGWDVAINLDVLGWSPWMGDHRNEYDGATIVTETFLN